MKSLLTALFLICALPSIGQRDTTILIPVTFQLPAPDTVIINTRDTLTIRDTVIIRDTVYLTDSVKPEPLKVNYRYWSESKEPFKAFVLSGINSADTLVIDKNVTPAEPVTISGKINMIGKDSPVLKNIHSKLFYLGEGNKYFRGFTINQNRGGTAFFTIQTPKIIFQNNLDAVNVYGGSRAYESSRGGVWDAEADTIINWAGTTWKNSIIKVQSVGISIFCQDGPAKFLDLENVKLWTDTTHNIYGHPNLSLNLNRVKFMNAGKLGLHHYSGGGVPGKARYFIIKNSESVCSYCPWEMAEPITGFISIDSSVINGYLRYNPRLIATNTIFKNVGSGSPVSGQLFNCSGEIWPMGLTEVNGGKFSNISLSNMKGGLLELNNTEVEYMGGGGGNEPFTIILNNSHIRGFGATNIPAGSKMVLLNGSTCKQKYNKPFPPNFINFE